MINLVLINASLVGTGGTKPNPKRFGPSNLIWIENKPVLIDCGNGCLHRLNELKVAPDDLWGVIITHLHYDHVVDLDYLLWRRGFAFENEEKIRIFGPPGLKRLVNNIIQTYEGEIETYAAMPRYDLTKEMMTPKITEIYDGWSLQLGALKIQAGAVDHGDAKLPCFGYRFEEGETAITFSGDTVPCEGTIRLSEDSDILVHECTLTEEEVEIRKKTGMAWNIHSTPSGAGKVANEARVKKLFLNHLDGPYWNPSMSPKSKYDWNEIAPPRAAQHFKGKVVVGTDLMSISV